MSMRYIPFLAMNAAAGGGGVLTIFDTKQQNVSPVPPTTLPDPPAQSHADLIAMLTVSGEEDFESFALGDRLGIEAVTLTSNGVTATVSATPSPAAVGNVGVIDDTTFNGRYNTTPIVGGAKYWELGYVNTTYYAVLTFSTPVAAFWLYATDTGDFSATLEITMHKTGGGTVVYSPDAPSGAANGALNFWGIVDDRGTTTYDAVSLRGTNTTDVIGLDGLGWCTAAQII